MRLSGGPIRNLNVSHCLIACFVYVKNIKSIHLHVLYMTISFFVLMSPKKSQE